MRISKSKGRRARGLVHKTLVEVCVRMLQTKSSNNLVTLSGVSVYWPICDSFVKVWHGTPKDHNQEALSDVAWINCRRTPAYITLITDETLTATLYQTVIIYWHNGLNSIKNFVNSIKSFDAFNKQICTSEIYHLYSIYNSHVETMSHYAAQLAVHIQK